MILVNGHGTGWKNSLPDFRDYKMGVTVPATALPPSADLSSDIDWMYDQSKENSCTCNCGSSLFRFVEKKDKQNIIAPSRNFLYYNVRTIEGDVNKDGGADVRTVLKSLASTGVCSEDVWGYSPQTVLTRPPQTAYDLAVHNKANVYMAVEQTRAALQGCLASGYPFIFGFSLYQSFDSIWVANGGKVPMPDDSERMIGGHAVMAVGYDDNSHYYKVMNSWGNRWGDHGYFYFPYAYMENFDLTDDIWTLRSIIQT